MILGKWLEADADILLFDNPTHLFMFQADTAQPKLAPCHQLVDIKAETYTYLHIVTSLS